MYNRGGDVDKNTQKILVAAGAIVLIGVGAYGLSRLYGSPKNASTTTPTTQTPVPTPSTATTPATPPAAAQTEASIIIYSDSGFSPSPLTVKTGTMVTIKNTSSRTLQFDSDPHPVHTDDPELNVGVVASGQTKTFTVTTTGSHGYHNHLNASDTGTLVVQ